MLLYVLFVCTYDGFEYENEDRKILLRITRKSLLPSYQFSSDLEEIRAGSIYESPFFPCRDQIGDISFPSNSRLQTIGNYAFSETSITSIDMSKCEMLDTISFCAFRSCSRLANVILPPNLKTIRSGAFAYSNISEIKIPDSVENIEGWAKEGPPFSTCRHLSSFILSENSKLKSIKDHILMETSITSFYIPKDVSSIGSNPFLSTKVSKFSIHEQNQNFCVDSAGTSVYNKDKTTLYLVAPVLTGSYKVLSTVNSIASQAFRWMKLSSIDLSNATKIELYCFESTSNISSIEIPEGTTELNTYTFHGSSIESIVLPSSLMTIYNNCFSYSHIKSITMKEGLTSIGNYACAFCSYLHDATLPGSITSYGSFVFLNSPIDPSITFKSGSFKSENGFVLFNGNIVENFNDSSKSIDLSAYSKIPDYCFYNKSISSVTLSNDLTSIGSYAFAYSKISEITLPSSLASIGEYCFYSCSFLQEIIFSGTSVSLIPSYCFSSCNSLTTVVLAQSSVNNISSYAFFNTAITSIDLGQSSVCAICDFAFASCTISVIAFPSTITSIGKYVFKQSSITQITMQESSKSISIDMFAFYGASLLNSVDIKCSISSLSCYCFSECTSLETLVLPASITTIKMYCFRNCYSLKTITIPADSLLSVIEPFAFDRCFDFTCFETANKLVYKDDFLMNNECTNTLFYNIFANSSTVLLPSTITAIPNYMFMSSRIKELLVPYGSLATIGFQAFYNCTKLERIVLPDSLSTISNQAFVGCNKLCCGCVKIPEAMKESAVKSGMNEELFSERCQKSKCVLNYRIKTCKIPKRIEQTTLSLI